MSRIIKTCAFFLILVFGVYGLSYSGAMDIGSLVDNFQKATDLQREQILQENLGREISASGIVSNAEEYDFFDTVNDLKGTYYRLSTQQQRTKNNLPYQLIFLFRDKNEVKDISKGEEIQKSGKIIKVLDERLQIAVWLFCGELTENDKALFRQD